MSTLAIAYFALRHIFDGTSYVVGRMMRRKRPRPENVFTTHFLLIAYAVNLLPFIFIGRVMFLYHYFTALMVAIMIAAITITKEIKLGKYGWGLLVGGMLLGFFAMFPITYGTLLDAAWPRYVFWLKSWI